MTPEGRALFQRIGKLFDDDMRKLRANDAAGEVRQAIEDYELTVGASANNIQALADEQVRLIRAASERTLAEYLDRITVLEQRARA